MDIYFCIFEKVKVRQKKYFYIARENYLFIFLNMDDTKKGSSVGFEFISGLK